MNAPLAIKRELIAPRVEKSRRLLPVDTRLLNGVPNLLLSAQTPIHVRVAKILGMKPAQIIKALKENSKSVFKSITSVGIDSRLGMPRDDKDNCHVHVAYVDAALRGKMIQEHAEAAFSGEKADSIPVLEYALLKAWNPCLNFAAGDYADQKPVLPFRMSMSSDLFQASFRKPWRSDEGFNPFWAIAAADLVLADVHSWSHKTREEKAALAGAAFAVASIADCPDFLQAILDIEPEMATYLHGVAIDNKEKEWDGSEWPRTQTLVEAQRRAVAACLGGISVISNDLLYSLDMKMIDNLRALLDSCEGILSSVSANVLSSSQKYLETARDELNVMLNNFAVTGRGFDFSDVLKHIDAWICLSADELMQSPSAGQGELMNLLGQTCMDITTGLTQLVSDFHAISVKHQEIVSAKQTWQQQCEQMMAMNVALDAFVAGCATFNESFANRELPVLPEAGSEPLVHDDPELVTARETITELKEKMAALQETASNLQLRASGLDQENSDLRREVSDLRIQLKSYTHAFSSDAPEATEALSKGVLEVIEANMIPSASPKAVLELLQACYPNRLRILDSGWESADEHSSSLPSVALYERIKLLATAGVDMLRQTGRVYELREVMPGGIATQESETVRNCEKLRKMRRFKDGTKRREIFIHTSLDYSNRMYFDYDVEEDRVLIAYVGKHLPSARNTTT